MRWVCDVIVESTDGRTLEATIYVWSDGAAEAANKVEVGVEGLMPRAKILELNLQSEPFATEDEKILPPNFREICNQPLPTLGVLQRIRAALAVIVGSKLK